MDAQQELQDRLARIEARLDALAQRLEMPLPAAPVATTPKAIAKTPAYKPPPRAAAEEGSGASRLMAWGAAVAFLLAAIYLLRIVYDSGWLTPPRQVGLALLGGLALIATGLFVSRIDRMYAAFLPAAGTVVLYITAYAAHLHYDLIARGGAFAAIGATSIVALWLGRTFNNSVFAVLATVGTYLFPLWLTQGDVAIGDFIVYYAVWGLVFAITALIEGRRTAYVLSMFCALISFQIAWQLGGTKADWASVAAFQCFQFLLSAVTAVAFSLIHRSPMSSEVAFVHGVALFYFYMLQYALLRHYAPDIVGFFALGSAVFVLAIYLVARSVLPAAQRVAGALLTSSYCAVVTAHILVFEWLPGAWLPWAALLAPLAGLAFSPVFRDTPQALLPIRLVSLVVFAVGFLASLFNDAGQMVPLPNAILFAYAAAIYLGYALLREQGTTHGANVALLYAGHISAMLACSRALDSAFYSAGFSISLAWALLALAALGTALALRDRNIGRSSLLIFAASAGKVLVFDLHGANSLLRVLSLLVVGISLYAGGWLYQRMFKDPESSTVEIHP